MRSHHNMGGQPAGKCEPDEREYELWEKRVDALMMLLSDQERQLLKVDELRRNIERRAHDSATDMRYMVPPLRPTGTEKLAEAELAALVTRDSLIGVALANVPAQAV